MHILWNISVHCHPWWQEVCLATFSKKERREGGHEPNTFATWRHLITNFRFYFLGFCNYYLSMQPYLVGFFECHLYNCFHMPYIIAYYLLFSNITYQSSLIPPTLHSLCLTQIIILFFFAFLSFLLLICLVAPRVALSTAPTVHVANRKRGRSSRIHPPP